MGVGRRVTASCRSGWPRCTCSGSRPGCCSSTSTSRRAASPGPTRTARRRSSSGSAGCSAISPPTIARSSVAAPSSASWPSGTSRWRMTGLVLDWQDYDRIYNAAGLIPPKDHTPVQEELFVYDDDIRQVGYATSFMYSPMLQRHIAMARVRPDLARLGSSVAPGGRREPPLRVRQGDDRPPAALQPGPEDGLTCRRRRRRRAESDGHAGRDALGDADRRSNLRRDRRRRRPQRPGQRRVPGQGRAQDADPRAPPDRRRRGDHRGAAARASRSRPSRTR